MLTSMKKLNWAEPKFCKRCQQEKPLKEFADHKSRITVNCNECKREQGSWGYKRTWTDDQLIEAVKNNNSLSGVLRELNLSISGDHFKYIPQHIQRLNCDTSHWYLENQFRNETHKRCCACHEWKTYEENFFKNNSSKDGYTAICKPCKAQRQLQHSWNKTHKLTLEEYSELLQKQNFKCAICQTDHTEDTRHTRLHVDHCHSTNKVRGLLCVRCNTSIGKFEDRVDLLDSAIKYLREYS